MAALSDAYAPRLVDLRELSTDDLDPLLHDEAVAWRSVLCWDFTASADLVRRFVKIRALNGYALVQAATTVGYAYYVCEDRKALIGDLFIRREFATVENEDRLLGEVLRALSGMTSLERIEAQLMMMRGPFDRQLPFSRFVRVQPRNFMMADTTLVDDLPVGKAIASCTFRFWDESRQDEAAHLIARAYRGHVDSTINDQYRSVSGAKRFLTNIVQYPGCGSFFEPASLLAEDQTGRLLGVCLASMVASNVGHVTQICVDPDVQQTGIGYEMLRRSMRVFASHGCTKTSLTVTASNQRAIDLYQRVGFRSLRRFAAMVWEGF
jgi:ribosomal protein S18 acetylase RimI-like enzyme